MLETFPALTQAVVTPSTAGKKWGSVSPSLFQMCRAPSYLRPDCWELLAVSSIPSPR